MQSRKIKTKYGNVFLTFTRGHSVSAFIAIHMVIENCSKNTLLFSDKFGKLVNLYFYLGTKNKISFVTGYGSMYGIAISSKDKSLLSNFCRKTISNLLKTDSSFRNKMNTFINSIYREKKNKLNSLNRKLEKNSNYMYSLMYL